MDTSPQPAPAAALPAGRSPLFVVALLFSLGIVIGRYAWRPATWWIIAAVTTVAAAAWMIGRKPRLSVVFAGMALVMLGALALQLRPVPGAPPAGLEALCDSDEEVIVTGHVTRDSTTRSGAFGGERQVLDVEAEELRADSRLVLGPVGMRLSVYSPRTREEDDDDEAPAQPLHYGDRLRFPAKLRLPRNFQNPGALDYRSYLREQGVEVLATTRADRVERLASTAGNRLGRWRSGLRRTLLARMAELWNRRDAALIAAMVIGDDSQIDRATRVDFQRTGVYHVLVVSGLNVGILAAFLLWVLRRARVSELPATVIVVLSAAGYAYVTEAAAPILRATLMLAIYLGARLLYRERAPLNALGAAAVVLLVAQPRALFEASFQLTFLAVAAIAGMGVPLLERTSAPYRSALRYLDSIPYDQTVAPKVAQFRLDVRLIAERVGRLLPALGSRGRSPEDAELAATRRARGALAGAARAGLGIFDVLAISALMQVSLALPMAEWFHRVTILSLPANAVIVPLAAALLPLAVVALALAYVWTQAAHLVAFATAVLVEAMDGVTRLVGGLRVADFRMPSPPLYAALGAALAFAVAIWAAGRSPRWMIVGLAALAAAAAVLVFPAKPRLNPGALEVTMLDVGQAESLLVVTPEGRTLLVDAGGSFGTSRSEFDYGENVVSPYLWSRGIRKLDAVLLTHAHSDHLGGMPSVLQNFHPRELWVGKNPGTSAYAALLRQASAQGTAAITRTVGEQFDFGGAHFEVLGPPPDWTVKRTPRNNDSVILRVSCGGTSALLEADAERKVERWLASQHPRADLLKVAHNGSATSTIPELLEAVQPRYAMISVGYRNRFGHPRPEVLDRLKEQGVATYRTDAEGTLTFLLNGRGVTPMLPNRR